MGSLLPLLTEWKEVVENVCMSYLVFLVLSHLLIRNVKYASVVTHWLFSYAYQLNLRFPISVIKFQTLFI